MKHLIIAFLTILLFTQCSKKGVDTLVNAKIDNSWRKKAPAPSVAKAIQIGDYASFDLQNGLKVIVVENHKLPKVSYQLSFNNDPLIEGEKAGYVSFAGDLISKGTKTRSKAKIDETIDFIGASLSTSSSEIFASSLKKHSDKLLEVMSDVVFNPIFPKEEFEKMRKRAASGLASAKTNPEAIAGNIKNISNYGKNHPYGEVQTEESLKNITIEDCINYYNTYFKPNNAFLIIVGDITPDVAKMQAEKYFSAWKKGNVSKTVYGLPASPEGRQVRFGNKDGAVQSVINISYPVVMQPGQADAIAANVMNSILGGGIFSGRLMQNLREKKAYTYGARSNISNDKLIGNFNASASVRNEVTDSSVTEFLYEMNRIVKEPVDIADLELVKSSMTGNFARSLESPQTIANFALNTFRYNLPKDYYNNYLTNLNKVTVDEVQEMAKKYINPENCNIIVVGNKDNVADKLKKFDSDGVVDFYDPFGKKLEDNKMVLSADVTASSVLNDYLEAIGGKTNLQKVKTMRTAMKASLMGQDALIETVKAAPNKFAMKMSLGAMVMQEQRYDGTKAMQSQMGKKSIITEGKELAEMKSNALMFDQLEYDKTGYIIKLIGIESVDGISAYKISVTNPEGKESIEFYDVKSNYLIRIVSTQEANGNKMSITTDYKDYKEVSGIAIPHNVSINGVMPMPLVMEASKIEINTPISDDSFKVD